MESRPAYQGPAWYQDQADRYRKMQQDLDARIITPRSVIGTGYKAGQSRRIAEEYIASQLADSTAALNAYTMEGASHEHH